MAAANPGDLNPGDPNLGDPNLHPRCGADPSQQPERLLDSPQRQLPVAVLADLFDLGTLRQLAEMVLPVFFVVFTAGRGRVLAALPLIVIGAIAVVILRWWRTTFWVADGDLILQTGVLSRTQLRLPVDRIQQISTEQGIVQQAFNVRKVAVDSAGSVGTEFELSAVSNSVVDELRSLLVGGNAGGHTDTTPVAVEPGLSSPTGPPVLGSSESSSSQERHTGDVVVVRHSLRDLVQVGMVRPGNQMLSAMLALTGLGVGQTIPHIVQSRLTSVVAVVVVVVGALLLVCVGLIGGAVVRDYDMTVWRSDRGLRLTAGLLTKREQFARTERVQLVRWQSNPLERLLGRATVQFPQASAIGGDGSGLGLGTRTFLVPSVAASLTDDLRQLFVLGAPVHLGGTIAERARRRWALLGGFWPAMVIVALSGTGLAAGGPRMVGAVGIGCAVVVLGVGYGLSRAAQRRWRWHFTGEALSTQNGVLIRKRADVEVRKIQSVHITRGWWHRRNGLASFSCSTAGGRLDIPHLELDTAESLRDQILAVVEQSDGPWM